jgi:hypothetical protein
MAGTTIDIGPFDIAAASQPPQVLPPIQHPLNTRFDDTKVALLGYDRDRTRLRPGETLALSLYWQAESTSDRDDRVVLWLEGGGRRVPLWQGYPVHDRLPFPLWPNDAFIRDRYALRLPTDVPTGTYDLRLALEQADGIVSPTSLGAESASLGTIYVEASERLWEPPEIAYPVEAKLGDKVELLGYNLDRQQAKPGETVRLTLIWRCLNEMETAYTVFTHLLDGNEQMRGQKDNSPVQGRYPTTLWVEGEIVVDEYDIVVKPDTPPGRHAIEVGMYDPANLQRLRVLDPAGAVGDRVLLGEIQITD